MYIGLKDYIERLQYCGEEYFLDSKYRGLSKHFGDCSAVVGRDCQDAIDGGFGRIEIRFIDLMSLKEPAEEEIRKTAANIKHLRIRGIDETIWVAAFVSWETGAYMATPRKYEPIPIKGD